MMPIFANPAGLWVLLGVPAILAIHFLQQRARVARTSTWFLIEKLAPDSARGRTWDRLRSSRTLWLQLLAVLLAAWVLGEPRWVRAESAQTVVLVLDASASMEAFRSRAIEAAEEEMSLAQPLAARTTWVVMTTNPRQPPLYRGPDQAAAAQALSAWRPELGLHDAGPALRLARGLAGASGRTLLVTDRRSKSPPDQRAVGVGEPIENVGFAGATISTQDDGVVWRALVKNHANTVQRRSWHLAVGATKSPEQAIEVAPGGMVEISARLPEGVEQAIVVLSADGFGADDRLPIVRPRPKELTVSVEGQDAAANFFRKLARTVEGVAVAEASATARLRLARLSADEVAREPRGGVFWPPADQRQQAPLMRESVAAERDPLVAGLNWQGWFGTGPYGFAMAPGDVPLLWQSRWPLVFVRPAASTPPAASAEGRKLMLAFDWATSNADRLPATVLLIRRFLEAERDVQRAPHAANFDCGALIPLRDSPADEPWSLIFEPATDGEPETRTIAPAERAELRAPGRAGFFRVRQGAEIWVRGAAQFADPRQGDFREAERFLVDVRSEREAALERNTTGDPFIVLWLALLAGVMLWSWWQKNSGGSDAAPSQNPPRVETAIPR